MNTYREILVSREASTMVSTARMISHFLQRTLKVHPSGLKCRAGKAIRIYVTGC